MMGIQVSNFSMNVSAPVLICGIIYTVQASELGISFTQNYVILNTRKSLREDVVRQKIWNFYSARSNFLHRIDSDLKFCEYSGYSK